MPQHFLPQGLRLESERLELAVAVDLHGIIVAGQNQRFAARPLFQCPDDTAAQKVVRIGKAPVIRMSGKIGIFPEISGDPLSHIFFHFRPRVTLHGDKVLHNVQNIEYLGLHGHAPFVLDAAPVSRIIVFE